MPISAVMYDGTGQLLEDSLGQQSTHPHDGRSGQSAIHDDLTSPFDRDLSLIAFQGRVLEEARDERNPLLERVKFLGILGQNLDEFAMTRGAEWAPANKGRIIRGMQALLDDGALLLNRHLVPALASSGIHLVEYEALTVEERAEVDARFAADILPSTTADHCEHGQTRPRTSARAEHCSHEPGRDWAHQRRLGARAGSHVAADAVYTEPATAGGNAE